MSRSEAWRRLFPAARRLLFGGARQPKARRASEAGTPTTSDYYAGMNEDYRWFRQDELVRRCIVTNAYFSTLTAGFDITIEPTSGDADPDDYGYVKDAVNYYNRRVNLDHPLFVAQVKRSIYGRAGLLQATRITPTTPTSPPTPHEP